MNNIANIFGLSPMQEWLLHHDLCDLQSEASTVQLILTLKREVVPVLFEISCMQLIHQHEVLRTAIVHCDVKSPMQVVLKRRKQDFVYMVKKVPGKKKITGKIKVKLMNREKAKEIFHWPGIAIKFIAIYRTLARLIRHESLACGFDQFVDTHAPCNPRFPEFYEKKCSL